MSRDDGFAVMDVSTDLVNDPKIRKLYRHAPDHADRAVVAYLSTMGESWKAGRRVSIDDAWPAFVPFDQSSVAALVHVGLIDGRGMVSAKAWRGWFGPADDRRRKSRAKWKRANDKRHAEAMGGDTDATPESPRGDAAVTPSPAPSVPPDPSAPAEQGRRTLDGGRSIGLVEPTENAR
jgi:hypothetical protein